MVAVRRRVQSVIATPPRRPLQWKVEQKAASAGSTLASVLLSAENVAASGVGADELVRHLFLHHVDEYLSGAMHGDDVVRADLLQRSHRLAHVVFLLRRQ